MKQLTPEERTALAKKAAEARWTKLTPEEHIAIVNKAEATLTPEQRSAISNRRLASTVDHSLEQGQTIAKKAVSVREAKRAAAAREAKRAAKQATGPWTRTK